MAQLLESAQLVDQHGMAEMQIRRGGIETGLDPQRLAALELVDQFALDQDFLGAPFDSFQCGGHGVHAFSPAEKRR